jgi:transposase
LFSVEGRKYLSKVKLAVTDRFVIDQLRDELDHRLKQLKSVDQQLAAFAKKASAAEREARAALASVPSVGTVTVDVVLSELADVHRFPSAKDVVAYAGLSPGFRESAGKRRNLPISKEGSRLLRWALVEAAWRLVRLSNKWRSVFEKLSQRTGKRKAIVAVARRLLTILAAVWRSGQCYRSVAV